MLAVFLSVLKVIGIILLSVLLFVIALLLLLLFWPFFYKIDVQKRESFMGIAKVSWFLHLVVAEAIFSDGFNLRIKLLGIPIYDKQKKDSKEEVSGEKKSETDSSDNNEKKSSKKTKVEDSDFELYETPEEEKIPIENKKSSQEKSNPKAIKEARGKTKKSFGDRLSEFWEKILNFLDCLPDHIDDFCSKIEEKLDSIAETIAYYDCLLSKKGTAWVIEFCKKEIFLILKHLKPYKVKIDLAHAAEDPEKVAKMYQYYGMALPFLPKDTQFASDFGEDKMEFGVKMKGRFFLFYLVFHVLKLILNKKVKKFIKLVKREDM